MGRLLFWLVIGAIVYALLKGWARGSRQATQRRGPPPSEAMVRCEACGLNLPESDALSRDGRWYCSREHLAGPGGGDAG
jgi:uncharacterized protein